MNGFLPSHKDIQENDNDEDSSSVIKKSTVYAGEFAEIDMVFLFADPLVVKDQGRMVEYIVPLDLDAEYRNISDNLHFTGR